MIGIIFIRGFFDIHCFHIGVPKVIIVNVLVIKAHLTPPYRQIYILIEFSALQSFRSTCGKKYDITRTCTVVSA